MVQSVAPGKRLGAPFQALTKEYQRQGTTRVTNLRMSMICDAQSPHESFANLDLKASETKHFLDAFLLFARSSWTLPAPMKNAMLQATQCMSDIVAIFDDASAFLAEVQWKAAMSLEKGFSDNYEFLST